MAFWQYLVVVLAALVVFDALLVAWLHVVTRHPAAGDQTSDIART